MNFLLINPPIRENRPPNCFPLGLAYIAKVLQNAGNNVEVLDVNAFRLTMDQALQSMENHVFDIIGITGLINQYKYIKEFINKIKEKYPNKKIIVGGGVASPIPKLFLEKTKADIVIIGEGEKTVVELAKALEKKEPLYKVDGIAYKEGINKVQTRPRTPIENLDDIPFPAWDLFPVEIYIKNTISGYDKEKRSLNILTSRGCPYQCVYCWDPFGKKTRYRSPDNVIAEIKELIEKYNINYLDLYDETFIADKQRSIEICDKIIKQQIPIKWSCDVRVNLVGKEILTKLKQAGCVCIQYGIESGSQKILDNMKKGVTVKQAKKAIELSRECGYDGIGLITSLMIGMIGETRETIEETVQFCKETGILGGLFYTTATPGTWLWEEAKTKGLITDEEEYILKMGEFSKLLINLTDFSDAELIKLRDNAAKRIYNNYLLANKRKIPKELYTRFKALGFKGFVKHVKPYIKRVFTGKKLE